MILWLMTMRYNVSCKGTSINFPVYLEGTLSSGISPSQRAGRFGKQNAGSAPRLCLGWQLISGTPLLLRRYPTLTGIEMMRNLWRLVVTSQVRTPSSIYLPPYAAETSQAWRSVRISSRAASYCGKVFGSWQWNAIIWSSCQFVGCRVWPLCQLCCGEEWEQLQGEIDKLRLDPSWLFQTRLIWV
jgi:hypothetical protein